ncbi:winged helix-turn-helix transcriptional regulator [Paenibacillus sp. IB182496]|uniref:Winged helix-turn-helix transcriptional regulator n=1 Tax=Paenibacillus sabuli TaxID=2772509 RepID=A0A927BYE9_9BACL|nr:MarR family winged helix-turn-helix transcriptional regulator [Paenibacillus sabuli]MBD2847704.1 winged helix-turn-helix transcriptional regulator [Paenibacillus sabuli]
MNHPISKQDYEQLAEFRYKIRKFLRFSEAAARESGVTPQQYQLLLAIMGYPGRDYATPGELAERLQVTHHACVELIGRSVRSGLVVRQRNPEDRRSVFIALTAEGSELLRTLAETHLDEIERIGLFTGGEQPPCSSGSASPPS